MPNTATNGFNFLLVGALLLAAGVGMVFVGKRRVV
ncbi:LPXTG cell wall anchor domain-containing protein [Alkalihalobacillus sp. MEB130]|nr:LPXTG cell wall anchor domain-containing protein [Alkalihalobacillus sp. MEB130]MDT8858852.1 LPXTG cell wall anchor domain-containing protein [Alkalihalobacillus sp. MEB130]